MPAVAHIMILHKGVAKRQVSTTNIYEEYEMSLGIN